MLALTGACVNCTDILGVAKEMISKRSRVTRLLRYARYRKYDPVPFSASSITEFLSICKQTLWKLQTVALLTWRGLIEFT